MFFRETLQLLEKWKDSKNRKPLVLRGARQVGKTTVVDMFQDQFDQYIYLNLELKEDCELFEKYNNIQELISAIFFLKNQKKGNGKILIFIDEIQNSAFAISMLRYFYEQASEIFVIAAGSLLETVIDKNISFPVGRVEYLYMKPVTFREYLYAQKEKECYEILNQTSIPEFAHEKLLKQFYTYTLIGGMPEVVASYIANKDLQSLGNVYESLLQSYLDDVEKYAKTKTLINVMRHAVTSSFYAAASRISFSGFGKSHYKSREMGEALRTLEKAMLIKLMYPSTNVKLPIEPNYNKAPRLHLLDTGLVNYFVGLQKEIFGTENLNNVYEGKIAEHIVGQELLAIFSRLNNKVHFWVREKKQSNAEVDFIIPFENYIIPIEVKSGHSGRLRSLHEFIGRAPHNYAIKVYSGKLCIEKLKTIKGKEFYLLNLPFYCVGSLNKYLNWFMGEVL